MTAADTHDYFAYWGKAKPVHDGGPPCHLLVFHSLDVAGVGRMYLLRHPALLDWLATRLGVNQAAMLDWLSFWLAMHDLGKFSVSFQNQRADLLACLQRRSSSKQYVGIRHDSLGDLVWRTHLFVKADVLALGVRAAAQNGVLLPWVRAVTGHHGEPPNPGTAALSEHFDPQDRAAAAAFAGAVSALASPQPVLRHLIDLSPPAAAAVGRQCSWWVAGIAVLADWLGSNTKFFPYRDRPQPLLDYWQQVALPGAERALAAAGVLPQPAAVGRHLQDIFTPERIPALTPLQAWADTADLPAGPQLYLLEDVTGAGKTEAALTLAYRLMAAGRADGLFIGLPTMATADAMFERVAAVATCLFDAQAEPSVVLAHGKRDLAARFRAAILPAAGAERDPRQADETASARCTAWLADHNKKALLAAVGVGTIDQALLAILHARHQSLRLLGLFRKVLIVDEVHACDDYMRCLLKGLLRFHAAAGGSAILVSATLTRAAKEELVQAYAEGRGRPAPRPEATAYPLITRCAEGNLLELGIATRPDVQRQVAVDYLSDFNAVAAAIAAAVEAGRCVAWVRNTVADAIDAWQSLKAQLPATDCRLLHARFALGDRLRIEGELLRHFGPASGAAERRGRIVVATQVIEQSLDLDFDLLISDLAPIDRLLQRAGRLRRHCRDAEGTRCAAPDRRGGARMIVYGPAWTDTPEADWISRFAPRGVFVYPHAGQIWLTACELVRRGGFAMPRDARTLIENVFDANAPLPAALRAAADRATGEAIAADNLGFAAQLDLQSGYARDGAGNWSSDATAPMLGSEDGWDLPAATRQGEASVTVRIGCWHDGQCEPWCDGDAAWEMSALRVPARLLRAPAIDARRTAAFEVACAALPDEGKWSVLLPFERDAAGTWRAAGRDAAGQLRHWIYDGCAGLREAGRSSSTPAAEEQT